MKIRQGFTFIEVIVSVFILSLIISGISSLETGNIRIGTSGKYSSQANGIGQEGVNLVKAISDKIHLTTGSNPPVVLGQCVDPGNSTKCPADFYYIATSGPDIGKILKCVSTITAGGKSICNDTAANIVIDNQTFKRSIYVPNNLDTRIYVSWDEKGVTKVSEFRLWLAGAATGTVGSSTPPIVTLTATLSTINSGESSTLAWSSTYATTCATTGGTGSDTWPNANKGTSGSTSSGPLTTTTSYSITCTGPGGSATASATVVVIQLGCNSTIIYDSANFIGLSKDLPLGDYDVNTTVSSTCSPKLPIADTKPIPISTGLCEDSISSIKVGPGCYVFTFDHSGFIRTTMTPYMRYDFANFVSDIANLGTTNMDDKISSLKVVNASDYPVSVYTAANYGGINAYLPYSPPAPFTWQDDLSLTTTYGLPPSQNISSVKVASGYYVTLYSDSPSQPDSFSQRFESDSPTVGVFDTNRARYLEIGPVSSP